ncbi:16S rRNA (uracil(1498)-N(3))-methyltransferase [Ruminococcus sp. Marseille-P6503]|uniref:16S rRNA (uracil(1498)-N(3))-methyltransferase n=1 Tax=Ruminococcus sp. Marseille-P6503 TaxID=2364796 RepID=UPI000F536B0F|nr:16S rRNA (uracil(1498)-N(3))-methyltransferase [Ruminococcus sp. Marseille-P6503]
MPRFFIDEPNGSNAVITGQDAVHIGRSLRMKTGDELILCSSGTEYVSKISKISESSVNCEIMYSRPSASEPDIQLHLFQALPKADKMDLIVQKAVELGVCEIHPILTERCVSRPDSKSAEKKRLRWQKIALEAAKQCGRGIIPQVSEIISFDECIRALGGLDISLLCYEKGGVPLKEAVFSSCGSAGVVTGSEGGFGPSEVLKAENSGVKIISLGRRILRCETAPIAAVSIIMSLTDNM